MIKFLSALQSDSVLLMDGAMGSELLRAGLKLNECFEKWNITHPDKVQAIHRAYLDAGAECILTNTFQSNPMALARHGLRDRVDEINQAAVRLARTAGGKNQFVIASIGPMDVAGDESGFKRTIKSLSGVDALLLETWSEHVEHAARLAVDPLVNPTEIPVLLSLTYSNSNNERTPIIPPSNRTALQAAQIVKDLGIAALGVNCGKELNLDSYLSVVEDYRSVTDLPVFVRPNAGTPKFSNGQCRYPRSPALMARWFSPLIAAGASMIGGCCGTTPEHIAMFSTIK